MSPRLDLEAVEVLLCDADGNLFPSEEPAFVASAAVTNRLLAESGIARREGAPRAEAMLEAGAAAIVVSWWDLENMLALQTEPC